MKVEGIVVDPSRVEAVKDWRSPKTPIDFKSFLSLARYYRIFIANFSRIALPMTKMTRKNVKFMWGPEQEAAFCLLKEKLTQVPILTLPE